ncbi:MAG: hypothetical protein JKY43_02300 [Phycisphaerales bacterium]|nr:hypothetical protein [Phycisphaerales bacterium]
MDSAVALVESYLKINGYFVVTDYPIVELIGRGQVRSITDIDILAVRFPGAGRLVPQGRGGAMIGKVDPELGASDDHVDLIIGEVKQGVARLNRGAHDPSVMRTALARFGSCPHQHTQEVVEHLLDTGHAITPNDHHVRMLVFASYVEHSPGPGVQVITLDHISKFITAYLRDHWNTLHETQFTDPAMNFLMMLEKMRRHTHSKHK